jgi:branched-chain amino acid transport system substrate-binding protein
MIKTKTITYIVIAIVIVVLVSALALYYFTPRRPTLGVQEIKIGVILPLSGPYAILGEEEKKGYEMAMEEINGKGGVLGVPLKLIIEDNQGKPEVSVSAAEKLVTIDKVVAIAGEYMSSCTYALLSALRKYSPPPIAVLIGGSTDSIEKDFGSEEWFFHLHPYAYIYQSTIRDWLLTLQPRPKTIFLAYEKTAYGTSQAGYAKEYLSKAGFTIVGEEPFTSGAADQTPLVLKAKASNPDVFLWIGYAGDSIVIVRNAKQVGFKPKLLLDTVGVGFPEFQTSLGKDAEYVCGIEVWSPAVNYKTGPPFPITHTSEWVAKYEKKYGKEPDYWSLLAYTNLYVIADAIERAGTLERGALIKALEKTDLQSPIGRVKWVPGQFVSRPHQAEFAMKMVIFQWQGGKKVVLYPKEVATGTVIYPMP